MVFIFTIFLNTPLHAAARVVTSPDIGGNAISDHDDDDPPPLASRVPQFLDIDDAPIIPWVPNEFEITPLPPLWSWLDDDDVHSVEVPSLVSNDDDNDDDVAPPLSTYFVPLRPLTYYTTSYLSNTGISSGYLVSSADAADHDTHDSSTPSSPADAYSTAPSAPTTVSFPYSIHSTVESDDYSPDELPNNVGPILDTIHTQRSTPISVIFIVHETQSRGINHTFAIMFSMQ